MKINADFTKISSSSEPLPTGDYRSVLYEIEEAKTRETNLDQLIFKSKVLDGEHADREVWDYAVMVTNKGTPNKMGLGRLKAYAEAIMGEEYANNPTGIDTDDLINGVTILVVKTEPYSQKDQSGAVVKSGISSKVSKVVRAS